MKKKKLTEEQAKEQAEYEVGVVESMTAAHEIADKLFGTRANLYAAHAIFDYLQNVDEEEFAADLKRTIDHAKIAHKTDEPTPEQVFGLFERIFDTE